MTRALATAALVALLAAGCGDDDTTAPSEVATTTVGTVTFEAPLEPSGSTFYSFTAGTAGQSTVMLASVTRVGSPAAVPVSLRIGVGVPAGEGCTVADTVDVTPALTPQLSVSLTAGVHCIQIQDAAGALTASSLASIRFTYPL